MKDYYLYAFLDSRKPGNYHYEGLDFCFLFEPFYIGKGLKNRINVHFYPKSLNIKNFKNNKIKAILNEGYEVLKIKLYSELTQDESFDKEIEFISKIGRYDLNKGPLTNLTDGKDGCNMIVEKTRKPVVKIEINTKNIIEEYISVTDAALKNNTSSGNISSCCIGKSNTHLGYFWKFKNDINKEFIINKHNKKILEYDYETEELLNEYNSVGEAYKKTGINHSHIIRCCKNELKELNGRYFRYKNNNFEKSDKKKTFKKIILIENNKEILFNSVKECSEYLNLSSERISNILSNNNLLKHEIYYLEDYNNGIRKIKSKDNKCKELIVKDIDTLEIIEFKSLTEASNGLNINRKVIERCIKRNGIYKKKYQFLLKNNQLIYG